MLNVSLSTLIIVVLVFLMIIFFLLISKSKPNRSQVNEMKETGWEIVNQIQQYLEKLEEEKQEMDQTLAQMKAIERVILQAREAVSVEKLVLEKNELSLTPSKASEQKIQMIELYHQGYVVEEIAQHLHIQKGIVEVVLNMEKMKKNA